MNTEPNISLDQTYHYPPELLEMLTEVIPCLFKSKQGVIDFFRGAGTPTPFLAEWQSKVRTDRDSFKKHEIARDVLRRLNESGDKTLAQRREVIKRVSEFEDFSTCYENDRYKAQGLVVQIQKVVNVKDGFTRINLEREKERKERQAAYTASVKAKQKEAKERTAIKESLYKLFAETDPYKRGKQLEGILNSLFSFAGFLIREAFTLKGDKGQGIIEQIDGAVEIDGMLYLVEMKWWDKPIGRQEIAPHFVSVYGRGNVGGIFISYSGFSPAAIEDAKTGLVQKVFVLDEAGELSMPAQAKLLRVLTDGLVTRIGSTKPRQVDVRLIVATHRDLKQRVQDGLFRDDLYYRLAVVPLEVPPLRERREDIPALCELFLMHAARDLKVAPRRIGADAMRTLLSYDFPGNIRELRNLVERACILSIGDEITSENFPVTAQTRTAGVAVDRASPITPNEVAEMMPETLDLREFLASLEKAIIQRTLRATSGAQAEAARRLGLSRSDVSYKLGKHNLKTAVS